MKRALAPLLACLLLAGCFGIWERESDSSPWVPPWQRAVASPRAWRFIVLHHSDSPTGNARTLAAPLGESEDDEDVPPDGPHHFVIGNGRGSGAGEVELARAWYEQRPTDHVEAPVGEESISICIVGDLDEGEMTLSQETALLRLCLYLTETFQIADEAILAHREVHEPGRPATTCPGERIDMVPFRKMLEGTRQTTPRDFRLPKDEAPPAGD